MCIRDRDISFARGWDSVCDVFQPEAREAVDRRRLDAGLALFKVPEHLHVVTELPRNAAGKVRKDELRRRAQQS